MGQASRGYGNPDVPGKFQKRWIRYREEGVEAKQHKTGGDQTKLRALLCAWEGYSLQVDQIRVLGTHTADKQGCGFRIKRTAQRASNMANGESSKEHSWSGWLGEISWNQKVPVALSSGQLSVCGCTAIRIGLHRQ